MSDPANIPRSLTSTLGTWSTPVTGRTLPQSAPTESPDTPPSGRPSEPVLTVTTPRESWTYPKPTPTVRRTRVLPSHPTESSSGEQLPPPSGRGGVEGTLEYFGNEGFRRFPNPFRSLPGRPSPRVRSGSSPGVSTTPTPTRTVPSRPRAQTPPHPTRPYPCDRSRSRFEVGVFFPAKMSSVPGAHGRRRTSHLRGQV